jgi:lambda repressor-like predicted transcriptional regulator
VRPKSKRRTTGGRPHNQSTPLGKILAHLNYTVAELASGTGIYNRTLTNYLAGQTPTPTHQKIIAEWLDVPVDRLWPKHRQRPH